MPSAMPPAYAEIVILLVRVTVAALVLAGLWLALRRSGVPRPKAVRAWLTIIVSLLAWFAAVFGIESAGLYRTEAYALPLIPLSIILPSLIGLFLLTRPGVMTAIIDATPLHWLVGIQFYRLIGIMILLLWADGFLPPHFALPAGIGDIAAGALAIWLFFSLRGEGTAETRIAFHWNLLGLADLVLAVLLGLFTTPGPTHILSLDQPNLMVRAYPFVLVPTLLVPFSFILHGLCIWKIRRLKAGHATT